MGVLLHCPIRHGLRNRALAPAPPSSVHQERFNSLACPLVPRLPVQVADHRKVVLALFKQHFARVKLAKASLFTACGIEK